MVRCKIVTTKQKVCRNRFHVLIKGSTSCLRRRQTEGLSVPQLRGFRALWDGSKDIHAAMDPDGLKSSEHRSGKSMLDFWGDHITDALAKDFLS